MIERKIFRPLLTIEEVKSKIDTAISMTCSPHEVELTNSLGKVLAEDVTSRIDVPGFDRSTMDGYAVKAQDIFGANEVNTKNLKLVDKSEPGIVPTRTLHEGETSEISTGAPIPIGANAVVMVEFTKISDNEVEISRSVTPGENVMAAGSDIMAGEVVLRRSQIITSREIAIMAAIGRKNVIVIGSPKVAILSTGNELIPPGSELSRMKIFDINAYSIAAAVYESDGTPILLGIVPDDEDEIRHILKRAIESADLVLTSGSTSAGSRDLIPKIISSIKGSQIIANGLAVKPGKPALVAIVTGKPLFALPGNPTSALMVFYELVKPTIRKLSGIGFDVHIPSIDARLAFAPRFEVNVTGNLEGDYVIDVSIAMLDTIGINLDDIVLHTVITETDIEFDEAPGSNGEREFFDVMRLMFPSNDGGPIRNLINAGEISYEFKDALLSNWNLEKIYTVAFIQNVNTKEIFQTGSTFN